MMILSARRPDVSLVEFLESRARSASVTRLVLQAIVAFTLVTGGFGRLPYARSVVGPFAGAFLCSAVSGLLDRARSYSPNRGWTLTAQYLTMPCAVVVALDVLSGLGLLRVVAFMDVVSALAL